MRIGNRLYTTWKGKDGILSEKHFFFTEITKKCSKFLFYAISIQFFRYLPHRKFSWDSNKIPPGIPVESAGIPPEENVGISHGIPANPTWDLSIIPFGIPLGFHREKVTEIPLGIQVSHWDPTKFQWDPSWEIQWVSNGITSMRSQRISKVPAHSQFQKMQTGLTIVLNKMSIHLAYLLLTKT